MTDNPITITEPTPTVRLRNGTEEERPLVATVHHGLQELWNEGQVMTVYELVCLCRNREHKLFGNTGQTLVDIGLVHRYDDQYNIHDAIRNIVLSCVRGEGADMTIGNPLAD